MPVVNSDALLDQRIAAIRVEHICSGITRAELDVSGGVDSAVMASILVLALGAENVTLLHSRMSSNNEQSDRAIALGVALGCPVADGNFSVAFDLIVGELMRSLADAGYDVDEIRVRCEADPTILGSIRSTLRAPIGRAANRLTGGGLRYGTGNECEDRFLRFYQKGGDGEVDNNPLAMLSKGEVYQLAYCLTLRIPAAADVITDTIKATPSPDLWGTGDGHSDEAELLAWTGAPFTYGRIDPETGLIASIGTIERVSRFLDKPFLGVNRTVEDHLFNEGIFIDWEGLIETAQTSGCFDGFDSEAINVLLNAARKAEFITRHKYNPNCPSYGKRAALVQAGILTNTFPTLD